MIVFRLALRELRGRPRGLWLLFACLFLGTAALSGIGSLSASIEAALAHQGRQALGGDLELAVSQRRASVEEEAWMAALGRVSSTVSMRTMVDGGDGPALVDLRAVDARWPLVGQLAVSPGAIALRPNSRGILLAQALAERLGTRVGAMVRLGAMRLRVAGLIADEPDRLGQGFRLGPPAIVPLETLDTSGLVQPGSLYEARYHILLPPGRDAAAAGAAFRRRFPSAGWTARTAADATRSLRRGIAELGQFLALVALSALGIACVGVASGVQARLAARTGAIATLKVLGARSGTIAAMLAIELGVVALAGIGAGLIAGSALPAAVAAIARDALPVTPEVALYPAPLAVAAILAAVAGLVAALPAMARARVVPAATLLRGPLARGGLTPLTLLAMALLGGGGAALAVLTAGDRRLAASFVLAVAILAGLLALLGAGLRASAARLPRPRRPLVRLAIANLHRPGAQTDRLVVALGLGFSLFVALAVVNGALTAELSGAAPAKAPRFFAIDLQPSDETAFRAAVSRAAPAARIEAVPSLRGTVVALNGRRVADMKRLPADAWILRGDRTVTWSATVPPRNRVVAGRWWPAGYRGPPLVSLGDEAARLLGLRVGDTITVAVLGVEVPARIAALRSIDWGGLGLNFAIVFSPGYVEEAPHALLAAVYAAPGRDGAIAHAVADRLPSVTLVRVGDVIAQIGDLVGQIGVAIRASAAVTIAAGIVVLAGAIAASMRERGRDAVLLKLLGATRRQVLTAQLIEFALLSLTLAAVALVVGGVAGWMVVARAFHLPLVIDGGGIALVLGAAIATVVAIGTLATLPLLRLRPAQALRGA
ncbi:ABC transporter permease [Sphingomonas sp.]|uniref:ABC transporter permease n=1 Tax=Sphingomonas sp. TaxID=28214 RepID=UPI003B005B65